jgi:cell wall-associated NlpC family hydrolase
MKTLLAILPFVIFGSACRPEAGTPISESVEIGTQAGTQSGTQSGTRIPDSLPAPSADTLVYDHPEAVRIQTGAITPEQVVAFAQTLKGKPYRYASCSPDAGFDCSGFVYYVFSHFNIPVPRSSSDFTRLGKEVDRTDARPGDLILFTGTDSSDRTVGHMGIVVTASRDSLLFIHSSSGSANGVTMTPLNDYYRGRFMKVIRVFGQNERAG